MGHKQSIPICGRASRVQEFTEPVQVEAAGEKEAPSSLASSLSYTEDSSSSTGSLTSSRSTSHSSVYSSSNSVEWNESYLDPCQRKQQQELTVVKTGHQPVTIVTTVNESEA